MAIPRSTRFAVIGAGVHGLSTAYHLARALREKGQGSGGDVLVLEKKAPGAGASGIACGVVRNFYFQPAMNEIMRISVGVWEEHARELGYHPVGYVAAAPAPQVEDLVTIAGQHAAIGYASEIVTGGRDCERHMKAILPDFHTEGLEAVLHEKQGGWAERAMTVSGLADLARREDVTILEGVEVTGFDLRGGAVHAVETSGGPIDAELVIVAPGPWAGRFWQMIGLPMEIEVRTTGGPVCRPMFHYMKLQEGEVYTDVDYATADGAEPPVIHVDHDVPLVSDLTGEVITTDPWGIYFKRDRGGVQGGAVPIELGTEVNLEPYGHENPEHVVDASFADYFTAGLAWTLDRFRGKSRSYKQRPNGGIGAFTPDNFPVFDFMLPNLYVVADSNHGFKMLGVGKEVANLLTGGGSEALGPFRFSRFAEGALHPTSHSPYPWN
ncbi:MAG: FAD-binding oxidoreductase [Chloroflexi bacterium]|nr:FAD-binding oxidoreductase [Chloroflexota bacterium]